MSDEFKFRKSLLITSHNRATVTAALEIANAILAEGRRPSPEQRKWDALPARIRAGLAPVFVRDIGDLSAWESALC